MLTLPCCSIRQGLVLNLSMFLASVYASALFMSLVSRSMHSFHAVL